MVALVGACVTAIVLVAMSQKAEAAFPGKNGDIIFTRRGSCYTNAVISRIHPDGTGLRHLTCDPVLPAFAQY